MKNYKEILEGVVNIINTTEKSDIGFTNICTYISENCHELKESNNERLRKTTIAFLKDYVDKGYENAIECIDWLEKQNEQKSIQSEEIEDEEIKKQLIEFLDIFSKCGRNGNYKKWNTSDCANWLIWVKKQNKESGKFECPNIKINDAVEVSSRMKYIDDDLKPIAEFILDYANWDLNKDEWNQPTITVPVFRVLDALINKGQDYRYCN